MPPHELETAHITHTVRLGATLIAFASIAAVLLVTFAE